jgi:tRNA U34 2-thiouridine synthase MnmA/TrmU
MSRTPPRAHGIGLLSGGLDSALAAKVVEAAGAQVTCLHFATGFCITSHRSRVGRREKPNGNAALRVGSHNGIRVELIDISSEYLPMVLAPAHGYGANMNPCIDCRVMMLQRARDYMESVGADFVFTGEVLGQRPLSQRRRAIDMIDAACGLEDRLLRPLSAHLFEPIAVERDGRVDRDRLYGFSGRSRRPQIELARRFDLTGFMSPAGGCCFLADPGYSARLKDLVANRDRDGITMDDIHLLGVGRHFRLSPSTKVIVGRDDVENRFLETYAPATCSARAVEVKGPLAISDGVLSETEIEVTASIVARYGKAAPETPVAVEVRQGHDAHTLTVRPAADAWLAQVRI